MSDESFPPIFSPTRSNTHDPYGQLPWIRRIRSTKNTILSFEGRQLFPWFWPVNNRGERVTPDELNDHRLTHEFRGPGCLCASRIQAPDAFTEARIFCAESGVVTGQWVAACGRGECKYFVRLEPFYIKLGHPIRRYDRRQNPLHPVPTDTDNPDVPPLVSTEPNTPTGPRRTTRTRTLRRADAMNPLINAAVSRAERQARHHGNRPLVIVQGRGKTDVDRHDPFAIAPGNRPLAPEPMRAFGLLLKLDDFEDPGLTTGQFKSLFAKCQCGLVMTKSAYDYHECALKNVVIDLTGDD